MNEEPEKHESLRDRVASALGRARQRSGKDDERTEPRNRAERRLRGYRINRRSIIRRTILPGREVRYERAVVQWRPTKRPPLKVRAERRAANRRARAQRKANRR